MLLLAGLAARSGYLSPVGVLAVAAVAAAAGDQCFYWIGRSKGPALLQRFPGSQAVQRRCRPASVATMRG